MAGSMDYKMYIDGKDVDSASGKRFEVRDPAIEDGKYGLDNDLHKKTYYINFSRGGWGDQG